MTTLELVAGTTGALIGIVGYFPYLAGVFRGTIRPNPISWLVWALLGVVSLTGQMDGGAGLAAAVTAVTTAGCALVVVLGLRVSGLGSSIRALPRIDWICLAGAVLALALLLTRHEPLLAVLLSNFVGFIGFVPTVRKVLVDPAGEGTSVYAFAAVKFMLATVALHEWSVQTWLYPVLCALEEIAMVLVILIARKNQQTASGRSSATSGTNPGMVASPNNDDNQFDQARLKLSDTLRADYGLLDPDQPTETSHREWNAAAYGPIKDDEFTPAQRAAIRHEFGPAEKDAPR